MLRSIQKLIGDKRKQLIFPIFLMSLDAIGSLVMYLMLYFTVISDRWACTKLYHCMPYQYNSPADYLP